MTAEGEARAAAHLRQVHAGVEDGAFCMHCLRPLHNEIAFRQACTVCRIVGPAVRFDGSPVNPKYWPPPEAARPARQRRKRQ